jgi:hypothetical protein
MGAGQGGKNRILNRVKILKLLKLDLQQIDENCTFFFDERGRNINLKESFRNAIIIVILFLCIFFLRRKMLGE